MNQNIPNPGLALRWPHLSQPYPLNVVRRLSRIDPSATSGTGHPGLASDKGHGGRNHPCRRHDA